jgi:hypothetical protein
MESMDIIWKNNRILMRREGRKAYALLSIILVGLFSCVKKPSEIPPEEILARIGDKTISVDEFIRRAEYTIRPSYCKQDNYIHKKIILNSLIVEKLIALEAGADNELVQNEEFQAYIKGRKEQAMRQFHYCNEAYNKVELDANEINKVYEVAGRKYRVSYAVLPDSKTANEVYKLTTKEKLSFDEAFEGLFVGGKIPQKEISFADNEETNIHESLFSEKLKKDQIVGPIQTEDRQFLFMKIEGWTEKLAVSEKDINQRWSDVSNKLKDLKAKKIYARYVQNLMKGKKLEFDEDVFYQLAELLAPIYVKTEEEKKKSFSSRMWGREVDAEFEDDIWKNIDQFRNKPFFTIDGKVWSVSDFENALKSHPLVFRKRRFNEAEFPQQFRLAVADLVRDQYINKDAYKSGYDKISSVKRSSEMWRDNLLSLYHKQKYLDKMGFKESFSKNYMSVINQYLNPYIDSLQNKYSDVIEIDTDKFEKIELTRIDMVTIQQSVPYPIVVPNFPLLTTDNKLDYGKKIN